VFSGRLSVRDCVCLCLHACIRKSLLTCYLRTQWLEFLQTLFDDVVEAMDKLIRFEGQRVKVKVATRSDVERTLGPIYLPNSLTYHSQI